MPNFYDRLLWILLFASHLVVHYIRITFFVNIFFFLGRVPLPGRILCGLENTGYRLDVFRAFKVNLARFIYFLIYWKTFLHSMLVLYCCGVTIGIFSYIAVFFIWLAESCTTQKTLPARGAAYVCEISLKSWTLLCFKLISS